jgi:hypothetical protein
MSTKSYQEVVDSLKDSKGNLPSGWGYEADRLYKNQSTSTTKTKKVSDSNQITYNNSKGDYTVNNGKSITNYNAQGVPVASQAAAYRKTYVSPDGKTSSTYYSYNPDELDTKGQTGWTGLPTESFFEQHPTAKFNNYITNPNNNYSIVNPLGGSGVAYNNMVSKNKVPATVVTPSLVNPDVFNPVQVNSASTDDWKNFVATLYANQQYANKGLNGETNGLSYLPYDAATQQQGLTSKITGYNDAVNRYLKNNWGGK